MFEFIDTNAPASLACCADAVPQALALMHSLDGCHHPRAQRLKTRLAACHSCEQLALLQAEVRHLLTLSFGPLEAGRRLQHYNRK